MKNGCCQEASRRNRIVTGLHGEGDPAIASVQRREKTKAGIDSVCPAFIVVTISRNNIGRIHTGVFF